MKIHWSNNEAEIVDLLRDYKFHCPTVEVMQKDDRARITSIRRKLQTVGYDIESQPCALHNHKTRVLMRRIVKSVKLEADPLKAMDEWWDTIPENV